MDTRRTTTLRRHRPIGELMATTLKILGAIGALYLIIVVLAWAFQARLAFPAPKGRLPNPGTLGFPNGERIVVTTADSVQLRGWYLPPDPAPDFGTQAPGMLWFYGNMESVETSAPLIHMLRPPGVGLLILDYRGYGESDGTPTEEGVYRDGEAAWDALVSRPEIDPTRVAVFGRSIGSAIALYVAVNRPARAIILDSPFTSGRAMAAQHYWWLPLGLVRMSLDNLGRAGKLDQPLLVFHGTTDRIVPIEMGRAVAKAGRAEQIVEIPGAGHNDTFTVGGEQYRTTLARFLDEHLRP